MSNRNIPNYAINWTQQLVTVNEMNIQLAQLINNVAYLTDGLEPTIINGAQVLKTANTVISITAGAFRLPDTITSNPAPYNVATRFYTIAQTSINNINTNGTYYLVARLITNSTDSNLIIYTGSYQLVSSTTTDDTVIAKIVVSGNIISSISYLDSRSNDLGYVLNENYVQTITSTGTMPSNGTDFQIIPSSNISVTLKNLTSIPGGLYDRKVYNFNNASNFTVSFLPNPSMGGSTIIGQPSFNCPGFSSISLFYDQVSNAWCLI